MRFLFGFITALVLVAALLAAVAYTGAYDIAATEPHSRLGGWLLSTTMHNSVRVHAGEEVERPPAPPADPAAGVGAYRDMCVHCHGAPGVEPAEWAQVMRPAPPELSEAAPEWSQEELYWIVRHGIKMSGMPAFGPTHSESEIWELVAFVDTLPQLTPREYERLEGRSDVAEDGH